MKRTGKLLLGGLAITALVGGVAAASAHRGGWGHGGHMGGHGGHMGMMGAVCGGNAAEMADHMLIGLEYKVKPTDAQKPAFEELKAAAKAAASKAASGCPAKPAVAADGTKPAPKTPTERLAMMEAGLAAQLDAVRTVRPAADKFYATLSDEQKKAMTPEHRGWGGKRAEGGDDNGGRGGWRQGERGEDGGRGDRSHHGRDRGGERAPDAPATPAPAPQKL